MSSSSFAGFSHENHTEYSIVTKQTARVVAQSKLLELHKNYQYMIQDIQTVYSPDSEQVLAYFVTLSPYGYIIVSSSYVLRPVIGYSFTSPTTENAAQRNTFMGFLCADLLLRLQHHDTVPKNIKDAYQKEWQKLVQGTILLTDDFKQWPPEGTTDTEGWVETQWHQSSPYNDMCPIDQASGERSVAGCPAVAIAQIINYHQRLEEPLFNDSDDYYHNYAGNQYTIDDDHIAYDFPSFPELNVCLTSVIDHFEADIELTDADTAALTFACGVAARQVYHPDGSGTFGVNQAYSAYQRLNYSTIELLDEDDTDLYTRLIMNILDGYPVHLAVVNDAWTVGHNLIIDGYNTDDYYHLNFGWGGYYDGWYALPEDMPYELTIVEGIIVDILYKPTDADIYCQGDLQWVDIQQGATINASCIVKNRGEPGSQLTWEITHYPEWGIWSFEPSQGANLTPEDEPTSVHVTVEVPNKKLRQFTGYLEFTNTENPDDTCIIPISLVTPHTLPFFYWFTEFINMHPVLEKLFVLIQQYITN